LERVKEGARLSRSAMETLAIVAYKQPAVRSEIEQIRGVDSAGVLKTLLERRLVRIVGRKDAPGRPIMYGTTRQFLQAFGLKDLSDLPALRDIKELKEAEPFTLQNLDPDADVSPEGGPGIHV
jgi:segregation and condensation protein B